jgi:hypothetical protein
MDRLRVFGAEQRRSIHRGAVMADLIYLFLGLLFFGLMTVYAVACDRL